MSDRAQLRLVSDDPPRRSDGHRLGDHGRRCPAGIKNIVTQELLQFGQDGPLPADRVQRWTALTGVELRTLQRWRREAVQKAARGTIAAAVKGSIELYKANLVQEKGARTPWIPTPDLLWEAREAGEHWHESYQVLSADPNHPLSQISRSTFYAGLHRFQDGMRSGAITGVPALREHQIALPRQTVGKVNERWSVDLYTIKVQVRDAGAGIDEPLKLELVIIRDEWDDLPRAYRCFTRTPTAADLAALVGEAVVGWEYDGVHVGGPAKFLRCDQGTQMMAAEMFRLLAYVGMSPDPGGSYWGDANGGHERKHRDYGLHLQKVPGSTRGPVDHTGRSYDWGIFATLAEVLDAVDRIMDDARFRQTPRTHRHAGRTRFELYRDCVEEGLVGARFTLDDENVAQLAITMGERLASKRTGVEFRKHRYISARWADLDYAGDVTIASLYEDDGTAPETLYVSDVDGKFLCLVYREDVLPEFDIADAFRRRQVRRAFIEDGHQGRRAHRKQRVNLPPLPAPTGADPRPVSASLDHAAGEDVPTLLEVAAEVPEVQAIVEDPALLALVRGLSDDDLAQLRAAQDTPAEQTPDPADAGETPTPAGDEPTVGEHTTPDEPTEMQRANPPEHGRGGRRRTETPATEPSADTEALTALNARLSKQRARKEQQ